ncbi:MAG: exodeoxyribonuclease VII large subunit [Phycisphaerae bacterium]|nr:exodeoxyribonuclease VII large subunit [Phycisphaerae bacterium]
MSPSAGNYLTVSQLTALVKQAVVLHLPTSVHVIGQISNFKHHGSGHLYWTLKDERSEVSCVMWRSDALRLKFKPADGLEIIATGSVDVFERAGRYQLYVRRMEPRGVGALELAFRQLCEKLRAKGLFDPAHKKPLPRFPRRIAVVTSPTGAAVRDILQTLSRRYPCAGVCVCPVRVQGDGAAGEIAAAINSLNAKGVSLGGIDVMIVGRGGGSLEDLWAFNEEVVARAIFASAIPVISAVGHEVDVTIADLAADVRAATPTAAAELAVPVLEDVLDDINTHAATLHRALNHRIELSRKTLQAVEQRTWLRAPAEHLRRREQELDELADRAHAIMLRRLYHGRSRVSQAQILMQQLHPRAVVAQRRTLVVQHEHRLRWAVAKRATSARQHVEAAGGRLLDRSPARDLDRHQTQLGNMLRRLSDLTAHRLETLRQRLAAAAGKLQAMSYRATLERGFSITRLKKSRRILTDVTRPLPGDRLLTETATGEIESTVVDNRQLELFD